MRTLQLLIMAASVLLPQTPPSKSTPKDKGPSVAAKPFGLKGDVLGEIVTEFITRNTRTITLGPLGQDHAKLSDSVLPIQTLPYCSSTEPEHVKNYEKPWDVQFLTDEEKRAEVVKCVATLGIDDDIDFEDSPTVANVTGFRTVYYFFHQRLYMIKSTLPGKDYAVLRAAFIDKYGPPTINSAEYQNAMGAKFNGEKLLWSNGISQIAIGERDGEHDSAFISKMKDMAAHIRAIEVDTAAIGKGYESTKLAKVYGSVLQEFRQMNMLALESANVLITIWDNALRKECEAAEGLDRKKDM
jgi:hypothetical protein